MILIIEPTEATQQATVQETTVAPTEETTTGSNNQSDNSLGNKYIYQEVEVGRAGVAFNLVGEAIAKSVPLSNEKRTFGIALKIYYDDNTLDSETHYQEFNSNITKKQTVNLAVHPENESAVINKVAFAFVYGYNKNEMTVYNAMLNIAETGYTSPSNTEPENNQGNGNNGGNPSVSSTPLCINSEVISETLDTSNEYMRSTKTYDTEGNYVVSSTDESGLLVNYEYDVNGNITAVTCDEAETQYEYDNCGNVTKVKSDSSENQYSYNGAGSINNIEHNNTNYAFYYNTFNRLDSTYIGNTKISQIYYDNEGLPKRIRYANGDTVLALYDTFHNLVKLRGESGDFYKFEYDKKGRLAKTIEISQYYTKTTYYYYDFVGNLIGRQCDDPENEYSYSLGFDENGDKVERTRIGNVTKTITRKNNGSLIDNDGIQTYRVTDDFQRTKKIVTSRDSSVDLLESEYSYAAGNTNNLTTNKINKLSHKYNLQQVVEYQYSYDNNGNITDIFENGNRKASYYYDEHNQLIYSADLNSEQFTQFDYDDYGNIVSVKEYGLSTLYMSPTYLIHEYNYYYSDTNWKDKLTNYNGTNITYDANGNPLTYRDGMVLSWTQGSVLQHVTKGNLSLSMYYNNEGLRTKKQDASNTTRYYYDSENVLTAMKRNNDIIMFYYDESGSPTALSRNGTMYYYIKNLQGDIVKIINQNGIVAASYTYDVLGKILSVKDIFGNEVTSQTSIALLNPYRYRSYIFDNETGLYYLRSRYYDPVTGRFLNADDMNFLVGTKSIFDCNAYAYCANNPVSNMDSSGNCFSATLTTLFSTISNIATINLIRSSAELPFVTTVAATNALAALGIVHAMYPMATEFFLHSVFNRKKGNGGSAHLFDTDYYSYDFSDNNTYKNTIRYSNALNDFLQSRNIDNILEHLYHSIVPTFWLSGGMSFYKDLDDLKLSIGYCRNVKIQISSIKQNAAIYRPNTYIWQIRVIMEDDYDFEKWAKTKDKFITILANNSGKVLANIGVSVPYHWVIRFTYYVWYTVKSPIPS